MNQPSPRHIPNSNPFFSGEWNGFYREPHRSQCGWMHLYIVFEDGTIRAEGTDYVGPWIARGSYCTESLLCEWTKHYMGKHTVRYRGKAGEDGIMGHWSLTFSDGPFHIWPRFRGELMQKYLIADSRRDLASTGAPVTARPQSDPKAPSGPKAAGKEPRPYWWWLPVRFCQPGYQPVARRGLCLAHLALEQMDKPKKWAILTESGANPL